MATVNIIQNPELLDEMFGALFVYSFLAFAYVCYLPQLQTTIQDLQEKTDIAMEYTRIIEEEHKGKPGYEKLKYHLGEMWLAIKNMAEQNGEYLRYVIDATNEISYISEASSSLIRKFLLPILIAMLLSMNFRKTAVTIHVAKTFITVYFMKTEAELNFIFGIRAVCGSCTDILDHLCHHEININ